MTEGDVERVATALPEVTEGTTYGHRCWKVSGKTFVWIRPLSAIDRRELGDEAPTGATIAVRVADGADKAAVLQRYPATFDIDHFARRGFTAVLVRLDEVSDTVLHELVVDAWLCMAPPTLAESYLAGRADLA